jgi:hypothetical protein
MNRPQGERISHSAVRGHSGLWESPDNPRIVVQGLKACPTRGIPEKTIGTDGDPGIFVLEALLYPFSIFSR